MTISAPISTVYTEISPLTTVLTGREAEVSALIARGFTNPEIAVQLGIAATTVRTHVDNIFIKLGVHRRVQIARHFWLVQATARTPQEGPPAE
jgi:DNA-binding CsgD family transcriptional regulator